MCINNTVHVFFIFYIEDENNKKKQAQAVI